MELAGSSYVIDILSNELQERWTISSTSQQSSQAIELKTDLRRGDPTYLDPKLWKYLPEDLLEHIRSMLPFNSLLRFCAVCRSWMLAILSSDIVRSGHPKRRTKGLLIQLCNYPITAFNSGKWESLPILPGPAGSFKVVATAGGLLCMRSNVERELVVWNPVTRKVRHLRIPHIEPGLHDDVIQRMNILNVTESYYRIGLVYDSAENCYRIIVAVAMNGVPGVTLVYYSRTKTWTRTQAVPQGFSFFLNCLSGENAFICALLGESRMLLEYHVQHETWTAIQIPLSVSCPSILIRIKGEIMLLTEVRIRETNLKVDKLLVFQLTGGSGMIEDILPQEFVKDVFKAASTSTEGSTAEIQCLVDGETVFFVAMSMMADGCWFRLRRESTFMRVWTHDATGEVLDSDWSCIGSKPDHINWAYSCRMMRSDYSRFASLIIVPSLVSQP